MADNIEIGVSIASAVVSLVSAYYARSASREAREANGLATGANDLAKGANGLAKEANDLAKKADRLSSGDGETELREKIQTARNRFEDVLADTEDIRTEIEETTDPAVLARLTRRLEPKKKRMNSSIEGLFNAYDSACRRYLEEKIDEAAFKREFMNEIRDIVCEEPFKSRLDDQQGKRRGTYQFIIQVYDNWFVAP